MKVFFCWKYRIFLSGIKASTARSLAYNYVNIYINLYGFVWFSYLLTLITMIIPTSKKNVIHMFACYILIYLILNYYYLSLSMVLSKVVYSVDR